MSFESIEFDGIRFAEIIRAETRVEETRFFSPAESSLQFGLLAHKAGFFEPPHTHKPVVRTIRDLQQMLVVQRGVVAIGFYATDGRLLREVILHEGDAALLIHGAHSVRAVEDMQCVSVKQGPFLGDEMDKEFLGARK